MSSEVISVVPRCEYHRLDNGVHEFVFHDASREAFDEFMKLLEPMLEALKPDQYLLTVMDYQQAGMPPLRYSFQRTRESLRKYPHFDKGRTAVLYKHSTFSSMAQTFINLLRRSSRVRFFGSDQHDAALAWLTEREAKSRR